MLDDFGVGPWRKPEPAAFGRRTDLIEAVTGHPIRQVLRQMPELLELVTPLTKLVGIAGDDNLEIAGLGE